MDILLIYIEINLTQWKSVVVCMSVSVGGWYGWNLCDLDGASAAAHSQVPVIDSPG